MSVSGRDLTGYGGSLPDPRWPDGARVAVSVVVNFVERADYSIVDWLTRFPQG